MEVIQRAGESLRTFRQERLSNLRPLSEFFDHQRLSRPADLNEATGRVTQNTRRFSGNYAVLVIMLAIYAILTNLTLLLAIFFLFGGFTVINRYAADDLQIAGQTITQKNLYTALFVIGLPVLYVASPISTFFWLVGSSSVLILGHASLMEPAVEAEFETV